MEVTQEGSQGLLCVIDELFEQVLFLLHFDAEVIQVLFIGEAVLGKVAIGPALLPLLLQLGLVDTNGSPHEMLL